MTPDATSPETAQPASAPPGSALARAMAAEIAARLARLAEGGAPDTRDLRSLPMTPDDRAALAGLLGRGEVTATVEANGRSDLHETAFPRVWWLAHHDMHGTLMLEEIAVTDVPDLLRADPHDMASAATRLAADLARTPPGKETGDA